MGLLRNLFPWKFRFRPTKSNNCDIS